MPVRPLDLLDLPFLPRYQHDVLPLDSARLLTRGNPLGAMALLSYLNPRRQIYTAVNERDGNKVIGQVTHLEDDRTGRLTFLVPASRLDESAIPLLEHLAAHAGSWGVLNLVAEVEEGHPAFKSLRKAGFAMYAWQRVWRLPTKIERAPENAWRPVEEPEWPAVQSLHNQIVPALLQPVERLPDQVAGLVCRPGEELQAYTSLSSGPTGIWIWPLIHPDSPCVPEQIGGLAASLSGRRRGPVHMCVRSYQAWLESVLEEIGAEPGPLQAVMVKRLTVLQREVQPITGPEKVLVKPAAPIARAVLKDDAQTETFDSGTV
ncbi:MAG: hypothetical protein JXB85_04980 [Anaerolineales bacterium]|nr:hypothetical protein [Anaerolineales bacterium]